MEVCFCLAMPQFIAATPIYLKTSDGQLIFGGRSEELELELQVAQGNCLIIINFKDPKKPNGRPESNDVMPIFKKDGKTIQDIDWSVLIDRHKVS